ncbi:type VII toxin-antitoxin system HepT family RNase toxin [Thermoflexus sp.]|uniref:type VII toxin-antitoxin system HepT family RNase toxin n=1 Tax=Thermoflexus sp. TaxID=1969742 RepID=UPI0026041FB1|nr:HepT-like ribonuclease domain-containing protein [Thermoflexus sp.]MCX7690344.1 DUF86 domain-containing protein [Thermoflexus sp.]
MRRERRRQPEAMIISREVLARALDVPEVIGAYLVGSWAQGYADALSDVDIALWLRPELPADQTWALLDRLYARLEQLLPGHEPDVIPLNMLPPAKQYMILKNGIRLFCKDPKLCADWEVQAARFYLDERPFREEFVRQLLERLRRGGTLLVDRELLADRLARLEEFLRLLEPLAGMDREAFCQDPYRYGSAERFLQLGIEAAIDIGHHIVARLGLGRPQSYAEIFQLLERREILKAETARAMSQLARLRNRLVHLYWEVDAAQVHTLLSDAIRDLREFMKAIAGFLG